jgi:hypothetical protein
VISNLEGTSTASNPRGHTPKIQDPTPQPSILKDLLRVEQI